MRYIRKPQTVMAVQITRDIDITAPKWFVKEMNQEKIAIDRAIKDGFEAIYGCTVYFYGGRQRAKLGDFVIKDNPGDLSVVRKRDFARLFEEG